MAWARAVWYRRRMEVVKPERFFHERFGLSDRALERVLGTALERRADWADLDFEFRVVLVVTSAGAVVGDVRPLVHVSVTCIAERGGRREQGSYGGGGRFAFDTLLDGRAERFAREAARQALTNLGAADAPAGTMTVVLGPGWPGVLLHEAIGHGLEGDFNRKRVSAFTDRIGTRVASELCTVVDDGTIADRRGSLNVDDEGTPTPR